MPPLSRREFGQLASAKAAKAATSTATAPAASPMSTESIPPVDYRIAHGRIRHSVMGWCFNPLPTPQLIEACHRMGMTAMEGIDASHYPRLLELGMKPSLVGSHGFKDGPTNRANHANCVAKLREGIDLAAKYNAPGVITFTGMREAGLSDATMADNCVACWKDVLGHAEAKGINLCLEHLNSRDVSHPMKGHPGYFGDDLARCVRLIERVDSPRFKLLFDIYHVQIMHGDVIRHLRAHRDVIGHLHTAGVPGRGELDANQELNYPAIMRAVLELGYTGYVAHEFIPTWPDSLAALRHGVRVCDV